MHQTIYAQMRDLEDKHWWFVGRRMIIRRVISSLPLPLSPRILDAGCGTGGNLPVWAEFGEVTGMELDDYAAAISRARGLGPIYNGSLPDDMPFSTQSFDLVLLLDVLEHIESDCESLRAINSLLAPQGYVVLTVPAFPFLWSEHDEQHHHKRRYVSSNLEQVIREAGLRLVYLTYFNTWLFPVVAAVRLAPRRSPSKQVAHDMQLPGPLVNRVLQAVFSSERHLVGRVRLPFGVSMLAIARKGD